MADWRPIHGPTSGSTQTMGFSAPVSSGSSPNYGKLLTSGGANTFGDWTWVGNAPSEPVGGFFLNIVNPSAQTVYAIQLGHDTSGSTQLIADKMMVQVARGGEEGSVYPLPLYLPTSGSIMARLSATAASATISVSLLTFPLGMLSPFVFAKSESYGFGAGDSPIATVVTPGVTLNVKGAWAQIHPAISNPIRYMLVMFDNGNNAGPSLAMWRLDIAVGGAGAEVTIVPDLVFSMNATTDVMMPKVVGFPIYVPKGVRLSARLQCNINDATDSLGAIAIMGLS